MRLPFVPDIKLDTVYEITPELLKELGISLLLLDMDNTLLPYTTEIPEKRMLEWIEALRADGTELFIVSNNRGPRPSVIAPCLGIDYVAKSKKPNPRQALAAMERFGKSPRETAIVGDQIYIDALTAYRAGVISVIVKPVRLSNPLLALRYFAELPFRALKRKTGGKP